MPLVRRRRPLLRAAAVGGAAYMGKRAGEKRAMSEQAPAQEYAPPAPAPSSSGGMSSESVARLKEIAELHDQGVLTDEEFEQQKQALLGGGR
jgi:putative oligomerization/nucleic acid binding protein